MCKSIGVAMVSTHSRPKAAGAHVGHMKKVLRVSTHSRPKAAGLCVGWGGGIKVVSTHSRPKAAGIHHCLYSFQFFCFNTQPPEGGWKNNVFKEGKNVTFQHTAARRRLEP